jgi:hypothetical protein
MRYLVTLGTVAAALVVTALAQAGGWATVGFTPLPDGTSAGETWSPEITVRQHGVTPLEGLRPAVRIQKVGSGKTTSFGARATDEAGVYRADVRFSSAGEWRLVVDTGWWGEGATVTYGPFTIESPSPVAAPRSFPTTTVAVVALLALAAAVGALGVLRTRRLRPAS